VLVTVRDVVKTYGQGEAAVSAVRGVSAEIGYKDFVAVCGPSGSGKTTLLSIMAGLNHPSGQFFAFSTDRYLSLYFRNYITAYSNTQRVSRENVTISRFLFTAGESEW